MDLAELIAAAARDSAAKGFDPLPFPEAMLLLHTEISEAVEEYRKGLDPTFEYHNAADLAEYEEGRRRLEQCKPEGIPAELADLVIRVCCYCGQQNIDLVGAIHRKIAYNRTRPHRHGGKKI